MSRFLTRALAVVASLALTACSSTPEGEPAKVVAGLDIASYRARLQSVRGEALARDVKVAAQTDAEFRKRLREEVDRDLPEAKAAAVARSLVRIGLLPEGYDLRAETIETTAVQAFAYYDPREKAFYLLKPDAPEDQLDPAIVHELDHALQDQRFDLEELRARVVSEADDDRENALTFLIEGEATYVMNLAALAREGVPGELADMIVETEAALSREQLLSKQRDLSKKQGKGAQPMDAAAEQAQRMPLYVYRTLIEPYTRGAALVAYVKRKGGWKAVDALFKNPPRSTEQCLHPEKLIAGEEPVRVEVPELAAVKGATAISEGTLGELGVDCLVRERLGPGNEAAAPGWAGDRYRAYARGARTAIVWFTTWDSEDDAREFSAAADALCKLEGKKLVAGETSRAVRRGHDVVVLLGEPAAEADAVVDELFKKTKRSR